MSTPMVGSFQWMKSLNRSLILHTIRTEGAISRAAIAKRTALTPPTVTNLVNELIEEKLVVESEVGESSGGRKPILLTLNTSSFHIVGVDVGIRSIKLAIADLNATVLQQYRHPLPAVMDEEQFLTTLEQAIADLLDQQQTNVPIIGIGIGMHGLVDPEHGVSIYAPNMQLRNMRLRDRLERTFGIAVQVENDVAAMALGEQWFGAGQDSDHFVCVNIGDGVGAGIVLNKQLYRGHTFAAGEIGHTVVDLHGPLCSCGNNGCLQTFVSGTALVAHVHEQLRAGRASLLQELAANGVLLTGEHVDWAARQGDALALETFQRAGRLLGISLTNLIHTLNPQKIIVGGGVSQAGDLLLAPVRETIRDRALSSSAQQLSVEPSPLGPQATVIGAVTIILHRLFAPQPAS